MSTPGPLEAKVKEMYGQVAREDRAELHFEVERELAEHLGYQAPGLRRGRARPGPGGRLALADIVSGTRLKEKTRRNVELWAACIAGAIPRTSYIDAIQAAGFELDRVRRNDYRFVSERALGACNTYEVQCLSLIATKGRPGPGPRVGAAGGRR